MSMKKKTPLQTYNPARLLRMGTCEVTRVEGAMEGTETLCIQLFPYSWKYPVTVDLGDTDLEPFAPGTPWKEILKSAVETEFSMCASAVPSTRTSGARGSNWPCTRPSRRM